MTKFEYKVIRSASSNITFHGETDWYPYEGAATDRRSIEDEFYKGGATDEATLIALEASGFECYVEIREVEA